MINRLTRHDLTLIENTKLFNQLIRHTIDDIMLTKWDETDLTQVQNYLKILLSREHNVHYNNYVQYCESVDVELKERCVFEQYTSMKSLRLNQSLYNHTDSSGHSSIIDSMDASFEKAFPSGRVNLYRGMLLPDWVVIESLKSGYFVNAGYSSFSASMSIANTFSQSRYSPLISTKNDCDIIDEFVDVSDKVSVFVCVIKNECKSIPMLDCTKIPNECEILVQRNAKYEILSYSNQFVNNRLTAQTWFVNLKQA